MILNYILLEAGGGPFSNMLFPIALMAVLYFFFLRPQKKKLKEEKDFRSELSKGDDIVTQGGIIGQVVNISGDIITIQIGTKGTMKIFQSAISKELTDTLNKK